MTNAEKFVHLFGLYATELWSKSEKDFLVWLNAEYENVPDINVGELISRQAAIDAMCCACGYDCDKSKFVYNAPQDEQVIMCPEHYALSTLPSVQPDIDEFLRNKSPKEHREILHWIAIHYYPRDSKEVLQAVSNMVRPDTKPEPYRGGDSDE